MSIREKRVSSCLCDTHRKYNRFIYSCWIAVFDALYEMQSLEKWCPFFSSLYNVTIPLGGKGLWKNRFYRLYLHEPSEMHFTWNHSKIISTSSVYIYKRVLCICSNIFSRNCHFNTDAKLFFIWLTSWFNLNKYRKKLGDEERKCQTIFYELQAAKWIGNEPKLLCDSLESSKE